MNDSEKTDYFDEACKVVEPYIKRHDEFKDTLENLLTGWQGSSLMGEYRENRKCGKPDKDEAIKVKEVLERLSPATKRRLDGSSIDDRKENVGWLVDRLLWEITDFEKQVEDAPQKDSSRHRFVERCEILFDFYAAPPMNKTEINKFRKDYGEEGQRINQREFAEFLMYCLLYIGFEKDRKGLLGTVYKFYKRRHEGSEKKSA